MIDVAESIRHENSKGNDISRRYVGELKRMKLIIQNKRLWIWGDKSCVNWTYKQIYCF